MEAIAKSIKVKDVIISDDPTLKTGNEKFDNWFSNKGGIVLRSSIFVSGTSGAGKSTLSLNLMSLLSNTVTCMYEREVESKDIVEQVLNIAPKHDNAYICDHKSHPHFNDFMKELDIIKPKVVIVDSLQAIAMEDFTEMSDENACNHISKVLRTWISDNNAILFLIGHNVKSGTFEGRNTILQFMDVHLDLVYDKKLDTRTMSFGTKNRKGKMSKKLYYTFEENGLEFHTEEEWNLRTEKRDFREKFINFATSYVSSINTNTESGAKFFEEYSKAIKQINKSDDNNEVCSGLLNLLMELSDKHEE